MSGIIILAFLTLTQPPAETIEARKQRIQDLHVVARSDAVEDFNKLSGILKGDAKAWEKHAVLLALRPAHKRFILPVVKRLISDRNSAIAVEAAVQYYRWTRSRMALSKLRRFRKLGTNLRRAFQVGEEAGRPTYDKRAQAFFLGSLRHNHLYTRLDGAMGLIEQNERVRRQAAQKVLESELADPDPNTRLAAVRHLSVQYDEPMFVLLLEAAVHDPDLRVKQVASQILGRR